MKQETKISLLKDISTRDSVKSLFAHEGWKLVEKFFNDEYQEAMKRLITTKDPAREQALLAVIHSLMEKLGLSIQIGDQSEIMFKQYKEKEKNEYV